MGRLEGARSAAGNCPSEVRALGGREGLGLVEAVVEFGVEVHRLMGESAPERGDVDREPSVAFPDVFAVGGGGGDGAFVQGWDAIGGGPVIPPGACAVGSAEGSVGAELSSDHGLNGLGHGGEVGWGETDEEGVAVAFEPGGEGDGDILAEQAQAEAHDGSGAEVTAGGEILEGEAEGLEPGEVVIGEVGKSAEPQGLGGEAEVLQDHAHLEIHEIGHELFELPDGDELAVARVVVEVTSLASREAGEAGGLVTPAFVHHEDAGVGVEDFQEPVEVHRGEIADGEEIG